MDKPVKLILLFAILTLPIVSYSETLTPEEVVSNVIVNFLKKDFSNILNYTELNEKKRVEMMISDYLSGSKSIIDSEISNLKEYKTIETYYENDFAVVRVEWKLRGKAQDIKNIKEYETKRYIMYLLKKFDNQWKVISKKVEI